MSGADGAPPLFSIITPTFNSAAHLLRCLGSISEQTFRGLEILAIDGGSKDATLDILESFRERDPRLRFVSEPDRGPYDAMNKGIARASGSWLLFLGSDDTLHDPHVLSRVAGYLRPDLDFVYGSVRMVGDAPWARDGSIYDGEFSDEKLLEGNISHQCIFYHRRLFQRFGNYDLRFPVCADWEFNLRVLRRIRKKHLDLVVADFGAGGLSSSLRDELAGVHHLEWRADFQSLSLLSEFYARHLPELSRLVLASAVQRRYRSLIRFGSILGIHTTRNLALWARDRWRLRRRRPA